MAYGIIDRSVKKWWGRGGGNSGLKMTLSLYMTVSSRLIKKNIIYNARREKSVNRDYENKIFILDFFPVKLAVCLWNKTPLDMEAFFPTV